MQASEFKQTFLPLSRKIYWMTWRLTGNAQEAEDLAQEVFLQLWTKRESLGDIGNPEAFCSVLARNIFLNKTRKRQVMQLIGRLPEQQRRVVTLHDVEGWSKEEIHQQTGLTATHIRVLLSRARKAIRQMFKS